MSLNKSQHVLQLICEAKEVFYHGTTTTFLREILKKGLVPDPKKKTWDSDTGVLASYPGTYFTVDFMTALSAAGNTRNKFGGDRIIIEVQVETRTGLMDEDELPNIYNEICRAYHVSMNSWFAKELLDNKVDETQMIDSIANSWTDKLNDWSRKHRVMSVQKKQKMKKYIIDFAWATIANVAEYDTDPNKEIPELRKAKEELIKAINYAGRQDVGLVGNIRINEPVNYRGANKILSITQLIGYDTHDAKRHVILKPVYGKPSAKLIKDYGNRIGGDFEVGKK